MSRRTEELRQIVKEQDLSLSEGFTVEGPWGHKNLAGLEVPVFIFLPPTGEKKVIGKATADTEHGLKFKVELQEEYKDIDRNMFSFDVPMRFTAIRR